MSLWHFPVQCSCSSLQAVAAVQWSSTMVSTLEHGHSRIRLETSQSKESRQKSNETNENTQTNQRRGKKEKRQYCATEALLQFLYPRIVYQEFTKLLLAEILVDYSLSLLLFKSAGQLQSKLKRLKTKFLQVPVQSHPKTTSCSWKTPKSASAMQKRQVLRLTS